MCQIFWHGQAASRPSLQAASEGRTLPDWGLGRIKGGDFWRRKSWPCLSQGPLRSLRLSCCFFAVFGLTGPSAGPGTRLGEARLQGGQGDEDGLLEGSAAMGWGLARLSHLGPTPRGLLPSTEPQGHSGQARPHPADLPRAGCVPCWGRALPLCSSLSPSVKRVHGNTCLPASGSRLGEFSAPGQGGCRGSCGEGVAPVGPSGTDWSCPPV